jgi:hypothetical protein
MPPGNLEEIGHGADQHGQQEQEQETQVQRETLWCVAGAEHLRPEHQSNGNRDEKIKAHGTPGVRPAQPFTKVHPQRLL